MTFAVSFPSEESSGRLRSDDLTRRTFDTRGTWKLFASQEAVACMPQALGASGIAANQLAPPNMSRGPRKGAQDLRPVSHTVSEKHFVGARHLPRNYRRNERLASQPPHSTARRRRHDGRCRTAAAGYAPSDGRERNGKLLHYRCTQMTAGSMSERPIEPAVFKVSFIVACRLAGSSHLASEARSPHQQPSIDLVSP